MIDGGRNVGLGLIASTVAGLVASDGAVTGSLGAEVGAGDWKIGSDWEIAGSLGALAGAGDWKSGCDLVCTGCVDAVTVRGRLAFSGLTS